MPEIPAEQGVRRTCSQTPDLLRIKISGAPYGEGTGVEVAGGAGVSVGVAVGVFLGVFVSRGVAVAVGVGVGCSGSGVGGSVGISVGVGEGSTQVSVLWHFEHWPRPWLAGRSELWQATQLV